MEKKLASRPRFVAQSEFMESNWAAENLRTIRTIMERSALYRRALAPMMLMAGSIGVAGAVLPCFVAIESNRHFSLYWLAVSLIALGAVFYFARREAIKESEPFWSPPMRHVANGLLPPFTVGLLAALFFLWHDTVPDAPGLLASVWVLSYGLGLHTAGFFTQRGINVLGWFFTLAGSTLLASCAFIPALRTPEAAHYIMGTAFGVLHLAFGVYLRFTENRGQFP